MDETFGYSFKVFVPTCGGETAAPLGEDHEHEVVCKVAPGQVHLQGGVRRNEAVDDGHGEGYAIAGLHGDAGGTTRGVQGQHCRVGHVHSRGVEGLKQDLRETGLAVITFPKVTIYTYAVTY